MSEKQSEVERRQEVRIHIDEKPHESPNPTTGEALYVLGNVRHGHELYREVEGDREDEEVPKNNEAVHLEEDEHFHSSAHEDKHLVTVFYKNEPYKIPRGVYTTEKLIDIFKVPAGYLLNLKERDGDLVTLKPGQELRVKCGMRFFSQVPGGGSS
jgi:hypothetical protein